METLLTKIDAISRLLPEDVSLFRHEFDLYDLCYASSWLYMLRAARNDDGQPGYKFCQPNALLGMGFRNGILHLVHPVGSKRFEAVNTLCPSLFSLIKSPILIKKVDIDLYSYLRTIDHFQEAEMVCNRDHLEEEAFPETVIKLDSLFFDDATLRPEADKLARKVRRFQQSSINLTVKTDFCQADLDTVLTYFRSLVASKQGKYLAYKAIITEVLSSMSQESPYKVIAFYESNKLHGLYVGEFLSKEKMGLYCAVSSTAFPGITEWMDVYFMRDAFNNGVKDMFLGGSETIGVKNYICKLLPQPVPYSMSALIYAP